MLWIKTRDPSHFQASVPILNANRSRQTIRSERTGRLTEAPRSAAHVLGFTATTSTRIQDADMCLCCDLRASSDEPCLRCHTSHANCIPTPLTERRTKERAKFSSIIRPLNQTDRRAEPKRKRRRSEDCALSDGPHPPLSICSFFRNGMPGREAVVVTLTR